jgi:DNA-binding MarR family transcriptional regulator
MKEDSLTASKYGHIPIYMPDAQSLNPGPCHCAALRKAARRVTQLYDAALAPTGLTVTQVSTLAVLARPGEQPPTMGQLSEALGMDRSTLGHNLRPLERDRLIKLVADSTDRRSRRVSLTPAGKAKFTEALALWKKAQKQFESAYGSEPAAQLRAILHDLAARTLQTKGTISSASRTKSKRRPREMDDDPDLNNTQLEPAVQH